MKKLVIIMMVIVTICSISMSALGIDVYIDSRFIPFDRGDGSPYVENNRTYVPLRTTMEAFGAEVEWDADERCAYVRKDTVTVRCEVGKNYIYRNNVKIENDAATVIRNNRVYLPIRVVLEAFGAVVSWDGSVRVLCSPDSVAVAELYSSPSVTRNYWPVWSEALSLKDAGMYREAIAKFVSISAHYISSNSSANNALIFKHVGECYAELGEYNKASACFEEEAKFWEYAPGMSECVIDASRRSDLIKCNAQIYIRNDKYVNSTKNEYDVPHDQMAGVILGAYAEGDTGIYDYMNPSKFYMNTFPDLVGHDMAAYLLYLPYGTDVTMYSSHISRAKKMDKIIQFALEPHRGLWEVNDKDGYLVRLAKDMQNSGCRLMLRFAGEMNDPTCPWYSSKPGDYIAKFQMVANIFHKYAPDVPVIWAPNSYPENTIASYYPGDDYVDYVGMSTYKVSQGITDPLGDNVDRGRLSCALDKIYSLYGHKKPIIVAEGGVSYIDYHTHADLTDFAAYQIKDFYTYLPIKYPNVKMSFIFDSNREDFRFLLSGNDKYLRAYREGIASDLYLGDNESQKFDYDYYELGNNVKVSRKPTELCSYITCPNNDVAYVIYYVNGVQLGVSYAIPYRTNIDLGAHIGEQVDITVKAFDSSYMEITRYTAKVWVE